MTFLLCGKHKILQLQLIGSPPTYHLAPVDGKTQNVVPMAGLCQHSQVMADKVLLSSLIRQALAQSLPIKTQKFFNGTHGTIYTMAPEGISHIPCKHLTNRVLLPHISWVSSLSVPSSQPVQLVWLLVQDH
jgi:hypothetical protein